MIKNKCHVKIYNMYLFSSLLSNLFNGSGQKLQNKFCNVDCLLVQVIQKAGLKQSIKFQQVINNQKGGESSLSDSCKQKFISLSIEFIFKRVGIVFSKVIISFQMFLMSQFQSSYQIVD